MLKSGLTRTLLTATLAIAVVAAPAAPALATSQSAPSVTPATLTVASGQGFNDAALAPDGTWFVASNAGLLAFARSQSGGIVESPPPVTWTNRNVADAVAVRPDGSQVAVAFAPVTNGVAIIAIYDLPLSNAAPVRVLRGTYTDWLEDIRSMAWDIEGNLYALGWIDSWSPSLDYWWGVSVFAPTTGENDAPARIIEAVPTSTGRDTSDRALQNQQAWSAITVDGDRNLIVGHDGDWDGLSSGYLRVPLGTQAADPIDRLAGWAGRPVTGSDGTLFALEGGTLTVWDAGARWTQSPSLTVTGMPTGDFTALGAPASGEALEVLRYFGTELARYTYPLASGTPVAGSITIPDAPADAAPSVTLGPVTGSTLAGERVSVGIDTWTGSPRPTGVITWQTAPDSNGPWTTVEGAVGNWLKISGLAGGTYLRASVTLENSSGAATDVSAPFGPIRPIIKGSLTRLNRPYATAVDSRGRIYAANGSSETGLPQVTVHAPTAGNIAPVASLQAPANGGSPLGVSVDSQDQVWVAYDGCVIARYPDLGASPQSLVPPDREWLVPLLAQGVNAIAGCRGVVPTPDGLSFWASNYYAGTLARFPVSDSGTLVPDLILSGLTSPWGLTLDPAGNVVVASDTRILGVTPGAGFVPQGGQTRDDWSTWEDGWTAWEITGLESARAAVRRSDGSTVVVAYGSSTVPFLQVLPSGAVNASAPSLSLTTTDALPFAEMAGFSVSADEATAFVPSSSSAFIAPISLTDGSVSAPWLAGSAELIYGGYLRQVIEESVDPPSNPPSNPTQQPSVPASAGVSPLPSASPTAAASPVTPTAERSPESPSSSAPAITSSPTRVIAPGLTLVTGPSVKRVRTEASTVAASAPVVRATTRKAIAPVVTGFSAGETVNVTMRRGGKFIRMGSVTAGTDGSLRLPGVQMSRPGRLLISLTDESGARSYVAIKVRRSS